MKQRLGGSKERSQGHTVLQLKNNFNVKCLSIHFCILFILMTAQWRCGGWVGQIGSGVNTADDDRDTCEDDSS